MAALLVASSTDAGAGLDVETGKCRAARHGSLGLLLPSATTADTFAGQYAEYSEYTPLSA
jgi:hypothetical protein